MIEFFLVVSFIGLAVLWVRHQSLAKDVKTLRAQLGLGPEKQSRQPAPPVPGTVYDLSQNTSRAADTAAGLGQSAADTAAGLGQSVAAAQPAAPTPEKHKAPPVPPALPKKPDTIRTPASTPAAAAATVPSAPTPWDLFQKKFVENWTGILGSVVLVMGVGFLGVYAAIQLSPFFRFLLIDGFAALLLGLFFVMKRRAAWEDLASWLRSSAGAVFLFGCIGSNTIPGLK